MTTTDKTTTPAREAIKRMSKAGVDMTGYEPRKATLRVEVQG